jgi:hypothetical protein
MPYVSLFLFNTYNTPLFSGTAFAEITAMKTKNQKPKTKNQKPKTENRTPIT